MDVDRNIVTVQTGIEAILEALGLDVNVQVVSPSGSPSPLVSLPSELLVEVFLWCISDYYKDEWIYVTHVCRHWRAVALGTPLLWRDIDISDSSSHPGRIQEMLKRAGDAPLNWTGTLSSFSDYELIVSELYHTESIVIDTSKYFLPSGKSDAPILRDLILMLKGLSIPFVSPEYPLQFLESLCVDWAPYPRISAFFRPTITQLKLSFYDDDDTTRPSVAQFLHSLSRMPLLEFLHLSYFHSDDHDPPLVELPTVELRFLEELTVIDNYPISCADVLDHLVLPTTTALWIHDGDANAVDSNVATTKMITSIVSKLTSNGKPGTTVSGVALFVRSMADGYDDPCLFARFCKPDSPVGDVGGSYGTPYPSVDVCYTPYLPYDLLPMLCSTPYDLKCIHTLSVNDCNEDWYPCGDSWSDLYASFTGLESLYLTRTVWHGLGGPMFPFQRLRILTLTDIKFRSTNTLRANHDHPGEFVDVLQDMLDDRQKEGFGVEKLVIKRATNLTPEDAIMLGRHVEQLVWDDEEQIE